MLSARHVIALIFSTLFFLSANAFSWTNEINLSVLTYNVAGLPDFASGSNPAVNTKLISPLLNDYQIVLVQEDFIYHRDLISRVTHPFKSKPDCDLYSKKESEVGTEGLHCLISLGDGLNRLSRLPFKGFTRKDWQHCSGHFSDGNDCLTPKGFTVARHQISPGKSIDVYNLHADAGQSKDDKAARRGNLRQLAKAINKYSKGQAVIVGGDTNTKYTMEGDITPEFLQATGLKDAWRELGANGRESIDKIFYRSSAQVTLSPRVYREESEKFAKSDGERLSDHNAISVDFTISFNN